MIVTNELADILGSFYHGPQLCKNISSGEFYFTKRLVHRIEVHGEEESPLEVCGRGETIELAILDFRRREKEATENVL